MTINRRDFLDPRRLAQAAGPLVVAADEPSEPTPDAPVHLRFARRAMATTFEVILPFATPDAHVLATQALDEIDRLEAQLTVYRDTSEVSRLNARAARHPVRVEPNLFELLAMAHRLHVETGGAFDVAIGALIKTWGFFRRQGRVPTPQERDEALRRSGGQHLCLDAERQTVFFDRPGLEINLGSIGKGYALDCVVRQLRAAGVRDALVHGGHSSIVAVGSEVPGMRGWSVGLLDPVRPDCRRAVLRLCDRGMATSAATFQHLEHEGRRLGHLLDPRTAWPAEGVLGATVTAPTAAEADALATAFFVLGLPPAHSYCQVHPEVGAVLIAADEPGRLHVLGRASSEVEA